MRLGSYLGKKNATAPASQGASLWGQLLSDSTKVQVLASLFPLLFTWLFLLAFRTQCKCLSAEGWS